MKKIVRLTERDLEIIVKRVINEAETKKEEPIYESEISKKKSEIISVFREIEDLITDFGYTDQELKKLSQKEILELLEDLMYEVKNLKQKKYMIFLHQQAIDLI
jgi:DNA-binding ferritin-like protein (Dps family)